VVAAALAARPADFAGSTFGGSPQRAGRPAASERDRSPSPRPRLVKAAPKRAGDTPAICRFVAGRPAADRRCDRAAKQKTTTERRPDEIRNNTAHTATLNEPLMRENNLMSGSGGPSKLDSNQKIRPRESACFMMAPADEGRRRIPGAPTRTNCRCPSWATICVCVCLPVGRPAPVSGRLLVIDLDT
jgi:hypothetical protein